VEGGEVVRQKVAEAVVRDIAGELDCTERAQQKREAVVAEESRDLRVSPKAEATQK
jgi:hypothetical protein